MIEPLHITTREKLRRWYKENHDTAAEMLIPCSKARTDKPGIMDTSVCRKLVGAFFYASVCILHLVVLVSMNY